MASASSQIVECRHEIVVAPVDEGPSIDAIGARVWTEVGGELGRVCQPFEG